MRRILTYTLTLLAVPVGVGVGIWTAQMVWTCPNSPGPHSCPGLTGEPLYAVWLCSLFGAVASVVILLAAVATRHLPN